MNLLEGLNQPTIDENIKTGNERIDKYIEKYKDDFKGGDIVADFEVNTDMKNIDLSQFDDVVLLILNVIINDTELDDRLMKLLSDMIKSAVPGDKFEPVIGKLLVELGEQLQEK